MINIFNNVIYIDIIHIQSQFQSEIEYLNFNFNS